MNNPLKSTSGAVEFWSNSVQAHIARTQRPSFRNRPNELVHARQTLDDELTAMHLVLCSLRTHCNTLSPISCLPFEILARILQFHATNQPPSKGDLGWIQVTHVCMFWHNTALHHPTLWNSITTDLGSRWLKLMVDRAKSMPLSYCQLDCGNDSRTFIGHVFPHLLFRIGSLMVSDASNAIDSLASLLKSPAPILHTLELIAEHSHVERTVLPKQIFGGDSPMLRRLYLKDVFVSWSAPFLRGLTYLHFEEDSYYSGESRIRDSDFFRALERMPALETLHLSGVLPPSPGGRSTDNCAVRLPHLRRLTLISEAPQCLHVFKQLDIPCSCRVHLQCVDPDDRDLNDFVPRLCRQFPATVDPFHTLSLVYDSHDDITIGLKLWRASSIAKSGVFRPPQHPDLFVSVFLHSSTSREEFSGPFEAMCNALPLEDLHVIIIRGCRLLVNDSIHWKRYFHHCRNIGSIFLDCDVDAMDLCEAMLDDETAREEGQLTGSTRGEAFLPNLELLELENMELRPCKGWSGEVSKISKPIVRALDMRRTTGKAVSKVRLGKGCTIDAARLDALKKVVGVECNLGIIQGIPEGPPGWNNLGYVFADDWYVSTVS